MYTPFRAPFLKTHAETFAIFPLTRLISHVMCNERMRRKTECRLVLNNAPSVCRCGPHRNGEHHLGAHLCPQLRHQSDHLLRIPQVVPRSVLVPSTLQNVRSQSIWVSEALRWIMAAHLVHSLARVFP